MARIQDKGLWECKDGRIVAIERMSDRHLFYSARMLYNRIIEMKEVITNGEINDLEKSGVAYNFVMYKRKLMELGKEMERRNIIEFKHKYINSTV